MVEKLEQDLESMGIPQDLLKKMFSRDYQKNIEGADYIRNMISTANEISDLLIKWFYLMMWGQMNQRLTDSMLQMMTQILGVLKQDNYMLMDFEF